MNSIDLKKMRMISSLWGLVLFGIVVVLTIFGFIYKKQSKIYQEFEQNVSDMAKDYMEKKGIYLENETFLISIQDLLEENFIESVEINENVCNGYIIATNKDSVDSFKTYIDCVKYKTRGYDKSKLS